MRQPRHGGGKHQKKVFRKVERVVVDATVHEDDVEAGVEELFVVGGRDGVDRRGVERVVNLPLGVQPDKVGRVRGVINFLAWAT